MTTMQLSSVSGIASGYGFSHPGECTVRLEQAEQHTHDVPRRFQAAQQADTAATAEERPANEAAKKP